MHLAQSRPFEWLKRKLDYVVPFSLPACNYTDTDITWGQWEKNMQTTRPIAFFLVDTLPSYLDHILYRVVNPYENMKSYIHNRWVKKNHYLGTGLPKGKYQDLDTQLLHVNMEALVYFVEVELAQFHAWCDSKNCDDYKPPYFRFFSQYRNAAVGLRYLEWEMGLKNDEGSTPQAESAKVKLELYNWWKYTRPARMPDPYAAWHKRLDVIRQNENKTDILSSLCFRGRNDAEQEELDSLFKTACEVEKGYGQEDTDMLIKLINIRNTFWT